MHEDPDEGTSRAGDRPTGDIEEIALDEAIKLPMDKPPPVGSATLGIGPFLAVGNYP